MNKLSSGLKSSPVLSEKTLCTSPVSLPKRSSTYDVISGEGFQDVGDYTALNKTSESFGTRKEELNGRSMCTFADEPGPGSNMFEMQCDDTNVHSTQACALLLTASVTFRNLKHSG